jgi:hypothetical protein
MMMMMTTTTTTMMMMMLETTSKVTGRSRGPGVLIPLGGWM